MCASEDGLSGCDQGFTGRWACTHFCASEPDVLTGPWLTVLLRVTLLRDCGRSFRVHPPQALPSSPPFRFGVFLSHDKALSEEKEKSEQV